MTVEEYKQKFIELAKQMEQEHGEFDYIKINPDRHSMNSVEELGKMVLTKVDYTVEIKF